MSNTPSKFANFAYRQKPDKPKDLDVPQHVEVLAKRLDMNKYEVEFLLHVAQEQGPDNDLILHQLKSLLSTTKLLFAEQASRHVTNMRMHEAAFMAKLNAWKETMERESDIARKINMDEQFKERFRQARLAYEQFVDMLRAGMNLAGFTAQENRLLKVLQQCHPDMQLETNHSYVFFRTITLKGPAPELKPGSKWLPEAEGLLMNLRRPL